MKKLYILGFGCADKGEVTLKTLDTLKKSDAVFIRTAKHPAVEILDEYNIAYTAFDYIYETMPDFDSVYRTICEKVLSSNAETVSYVVPGSAVIAERSVTYLIKNAKCEVVIIPSTSFLDGLFAAIKKDAVDSFKLLDALSLDEQKPDVTCMNIICQMYDRQIASDVKLAMSKYYDDETEVILVNSCATNDEKLIKLKLYEIDRIDEIDHLSTLVIPPQSYSQAPGDFYSLAKIIEILRGENGCPWDKAQTHDTLKQYMIEEAYESVNAIDNKDMDNLCEELGDIMLQILLHTQIAKEESDFELEDVIRGISQKMIRRHPHVFSSLELPDDFYKMWDEVKREEHSYTSVYEEINDIPKCLPALSYSQKFYKKSKNTAGFIQKDMTEQKDVLIKQINELLTCDKNEMYSLGGDILYNINALFYELGIDSEGMLRDSCIKRMSRLKQDDKA